MLVFPRKNPRIFTTMGEIRRYPDQKVWVRVPFSCLKFIPPLLYTPTLFSGVGVYKKRPPAIAFGWRVLTISKEWEGQATVIDC